MTKRRLFLLASFLLLMAGCSGRQPATAQSYTGFLENQEIVIAPEVGGRILALPVDEGDAVQPGQMLARLDDSLIRLQLAQADADVAAAQARLAQLKAAVRPEDVAVARARLAQAQAAAEAAESALQDAIHLRDHPQELDVQIAQARAARDEARAQSRAAAKQAQAADIEAQMWGEIARALAEGQTVVLPDGSTITAKAPPEQRSQANLQWNLASQKAWKAHAQAEQAEAAAKQADIALNDLMEQRQHPQQADTQVVTATNARDKAWADVQQAQAALDAVEAGPTPAQLQAAEAALVQARAARDAQAVQLQKTIITAPASGIISARYFSPQEVIGPGQRLLSLTLPDHLTITIYVPAGQIDSLAVGDTYPLQIDTAPERSYQARVIVISDKPEFTMRQAQNVAERAAVVYAVTLQVENPDDFLRPGLPAEIIIAP